MNGRREEAITGRELSLCFGKHGCRWERCALKVLVHSGMKVITWNSSCHFETIGVVAAINGFHVEIHGGVVVH